MSRPPPTDKIRTWTAFNEALTRRGLLTIRLDPVVCWDAVPTVRRGRPQTYSDAAIPTCLTMALQYIAPHCPEMG